MDEIYFLALYSKMELNKYYITLSSKEIDTKMGVFHSSIIDRWRGYVNDQNDNEIYGVDANPFGFNVFTNYDEKGENSWDYKESDFKTYE